MIDPQIFATCVTAAIAILTPVISSLGARAADVQRRRMIEDASALLAFERGWHQFTSELEQHEDSRQALVRQLGEVQTDLMNAWNRSRRRPTRHLLSRLALPYEVRSVVGWIIHALYYVVLLGFIFMLSFLVIGTLEESRPWKETLEILEGGAFLSGVFIAIAFGLRYLSTKADARALRRHGYRSDT